METHERIKHLKNTRYGVWSMDCNERNCHHWIQLWCSR